jgi:hypothetical protein
MTETVTPLARQALADEVACRESEPANRDRHRKYRFTCAAVKGHTGDHVPWGASDSGEGLRKLAWPNRGRKRSR